MKRFSESSPIVILLISMLLAGTAASSVQAASITFNLDSTIDGSGVTSTTPLGTLTLTDNGNYVDIVVKLNNPSWKILDLALNFDDSRFSNFSRFSLVNEGLKVSEDKIKQGGYKGYFDLVIPGKGNIGEYGYYYDTIKLLGSGNTVLHVSDFMFKDTKDLLYAGLHIGNMGSYTKGGDSLWVGASSVAQPSAVPEPSTVLLLGLGMLGAFLFRKRITPAYRRVADKSRQ